MTYQDYCSCPTVSALWITDYSCILTMSDYCCPCRPTYAVLSSRMFSSLGMFSAFRLICSFATVTSFILFTTYMIIPKSHYEICLSQFVSMEIYSFAKLALDMTEWVMLLAGRAWNDVCAGQHEMTNRMCRVTFDLALRDHNFTSDGPCYVVIHCSEEHCVVNMGNFLCHDSCSSYQH